jgi:hypothetical protein
VIVVMAMLLLSALGTAMITLSTTDTRASANQRDARVARYAAEGALERAAAELAASADWDAVLSGSIRSAHVDGPSSGSRQLPDGRTIVLDDLANLASCGVAVACSAGQLDAVTAERPWGANNPRWRLFSHGPWSVSAQAPQVYTVVLVADDPSETDGDATRDGRDGEPGAGLVMVRAHAFGAGGAQRTVDAVLGRAAAGGATAPRFMAWASDR